MKHLIITATCLFLISRVAPAQTASQMQMLTISDNLMPFSRAVDSVAKQLIADEPSDTTEGGELRAFSRWSKLTESRVCNNAPQGEDRLAPATKAWNHYLKNINAYCSEDPQGWKGNWQCLGPFINTYQNGTEVSGRVDALWIHPGNPDIILAGAASGGVWKTTNGGQNWTNLTDASTSVLSGTTGVGKIAVNPFNTDSIFAATSGQGMIKNTWGYTCGLIFSANGGQTWQQDTNANRIIAKLPDFWSGGITQMDYLPGTRKLFAVYRFTDDNGTHDSVYLKSSPSATWQNITPSIDGGVMISDLKFTRTSPYKAVMKTTAKYGVSKLWLYDNSGNWSSTTIDLNTNTYYQIPGPEENISLSDQDDVYLNLGYKDHPDSPATKKLLAKYSLATSAYSILNSNLGGYQFVLVSPAKDSVFYATRHSGTNGFDMLLSVDRGQSFDFQPVSGAIHADVRCIYVYNSVDTFQGIKDRVFAGTDGGIVSKKPYVNHFKSITGDGICISQVYGFSNTENDENILEGGAQDNMAYTWMKGRNPKWKSEWYGDNYLSKFQRNGRTVYSGNNFPGMLKVVFNTNNTTSPSSINHPVDGIIPQGHYIYDPNSKLPPTGAYFPLWHVHAQDTRPLYFNTDDVAYAGVYRIWRKHINDANWTEAFQNDPIMPPTDPDSVFFDRRMVRDYIFSEKNPQVAYVAYKWPAYNNPQALYDSGRLFRAIDVQTDPSNSLRWTATWANITPPIVRHHRIMDIEIDPENPARIWVAFGEIDFGKIITPPASMEGRVYYSDDYGATWNDVSEGLPALPVNKIVYQTGSDDILYAGTDVGVFKWNKNLGEWVCFSNGLPSCIVSDMELNYCAGKLRISTFGRGIWETQLYQVSAASPTNPIVGDLSPIPKEIYTSNATITHDKYITTGIQVKNGATLTIGDGGTTPINQ